MKLAVAGDAVRAAQIATTWANLCSTNRLRGPMARRLTTNQEIPGSTPGVIIVLLFCWPVMCAANEVSFCQS